jgi:hypothetical protein
MGLFTFLPIHAAGVYDTNSSECVADFAVSSYAINLSLLLAPVASPHDSFEVMVAAQPKTPDCPPLPGALLELRKIEAHVPNESLTRFGDPQAPASVGIVLSRLPVASIVHLACHNRQGVQKPFDNALVLGDGGLHVRQIMGQRVSAASLAFLSASESAVGNDQFPDEAMHLAASFLFAGFQGVVATMWLVQLLTWHMQCLILVNSRLIDDLNAAKVTDMFYGYLLKNAHTPGSFPDATQAAQALHLTVIKLRAANCPLRHLVSYVHIGL